MSPVVITLLVVSAIGLVMNVYVFYQMRGLLDLGTIDADDPSEWPTVSLVIPACNEEATIGPALQSILAMDYPALQILMIDDRSTDRTAAIVDALAAEHANLEVIHVETLPEGWLGKLHAMHVGAQAATGDFVVYADADVHFMPDALRRAVAWAERDDIDMLALFPRVDGKGLALIATIGAFAGLWISGVKTRQVNSDTRDAYAGIGAFNMVRRRVFETTEGWEWLRLEIADDIGLAYLMHRHGARGRMAAAPEHLSVCWYETFGDLVRGLEKNIFAAVARFSLVRALVVATAMVVVPLSPVALLFTSHAWFGGACLLAGMACPYLACYPSMRRQGYCLSLFAPVLVAGILLRSTYKTVRRGSVDWRGTTYAIPELKANQRLLL